LCRGEAKVGVLEVSGAKKCLHVTAKGNKRYEAHRHPHRESEQIIDIHTLEAAD
jgi:hypothetical protein